VKVGQSTKQGGTPARIRGPQADKGTGGFCRNWGKPKRKIGWQFLHPPKAVTHTCSFQATLSQMGLLPGKTRENGRAK